MQRASRCRCVKLAIGHTDRNVLTRCNLGNTANNLPIAPDDGVAALKDGQRAERIQPRASPHQALAVQLQKM